MLLLAIVEKSHKSNGPFHPAEHNPEGLHGPGQVVCVAGATMPEGEYCARRLGLRISDIEGGTITVSDLASISKC